ncbi:MAG: WYL domain-containing protein, partial [Dehalococcoidia bacterium]
LREGRRDFRLERVEHLTVLDETFTPHSEDAPTTQTIEVCVRFVASVLRWVRERQHYGFVAEAHDQAGAVMTYRVTSLDELTGWLRGWGPAAEVLSPPELRAMLREDARRLLEMLT